MATIGKRKAIAQLGRLKFRGYIAWLMWLGIHVFFLIGFRNRLAVMADWFWAYLTRERSARLITGDAEQMSDAEHFIAARPAKAQLSPDDGSLTHDEADRSPAASKQISG